MGIETTEEYKIFLDNVLGDKEMLHTMGTDPEACQLVFSKLNELANNKVPGNDHYQLSQAVNDEIFIPSKAASHFDDAQMLLLYGDRFEKWFKAEGFNILGADINNHIFGSIQEALISSVKNNHIFCLEYLITNVDIGDYDVDSLCLLIAIKQQSVDILELLYLHAPDNYGTKGNLGNMMRDSIQTEFQEASGWLSPEIHDKLKKFNILKDEGEDNA